MDSFIRNLNQQLYFFKRNFNQYEFWQSNGTEKGTKLLKTIKIKDKIVLEDIKAVVEAADGKTVKVIIETCLLTDDEKVKACELSLEAKANFVKTSTGFSTGGATVSDVALMRKTVGDKAYVKASGGVRDYEGAMLVINAGADRIGASSGVKIMNHQVAETDY